MRILIGAILTTATLAAGAIFAWRLTLGVEAWFATSGAGNVLMWSVVVALILAAFALPAAAWGMAARAWVIKIGNGERLEATHLALLRETQPNPQIAHQQDQYVLNNTVDRNKNCML